MSAYATQIQDALSAHLASEMICEQMPGPGDRVECLTPISYPSGDAIVVWVEAYPSRYVVTDYGECLTDLLLHPPQDHAALRGQVRDTCAQLGIRFAEGRLEVESSLSDLGDAAWRVATAASLLARASISFEPKRRSHSEKPFVNEVERKLRDCHVTVERERKVAGISGHRHTASIYIPDHEAVLEPVLGHWNQIASVYAKFGDLSRANGYKLYSLVDDRDGHVDEELARMLVQVSDVIEWSRRDEWIKQLR